MRFSHVPAWGFGKSKKLEIEKTDPLYNPGPGQYAPKKGGHGPTWRIGSALRESKIQIKIPALVNMIFQIKFLTDRNIQSRQKLVDLTQLKHHTHQAQANIILTQKIDQVQQDIQ